MSITLDLSEKASAIRIEGEIDISSSTELKQALVQAIAAGKELRLDVSAATDLDVTTIQLLHAVAREAEKTGLSCTVTPMPENVLDRLREAGFQNLLTFVLPENTRKHPKPNQTQRKNG